MVKSSRQAIALLVHKDISQINSLIKKLEKDFDLYIHIDRKSNIHPAAIGISNVWQKFKVYWGSYNIILATAFLYKKILETNIPYSHVILLSGDSLPVKSNEYINNYLSAHPGVSFIENNAADEAILDRRKLIWYREDLRTQGSFFKKLQNPFRVIRWIQKKLNLKRSTVGFERTGSQWTILALPHVQHLMDHCRFSKYRFMAVPDESFVQNHFTEYNIPHRHSLIYAHWPSKRSFSPYFIDEDTHKSLLNGPYLFARKFEAMPSEPAENRLIKNHLHKKVMALHTLISDRFGQSKSHYD